MSANRADRPDDDDGPDEATALGARRDAGSGGDETMPAGPRPEEHSSSDYRRSIPVEGFPPDEIDGSTMVARRESRRRTTRGEAGAADDPEPAETGRAAQRPRPPAETAYAPRSTVPVIVPRAAAGARPPQSEVDGAAIERSSRRRAVIRLAAVVSGALALVAASAILLLALVGGSV